MRAVRECHKMSVIGEPNDLIIVELKEESRALELSSTGNKAELISRLLEIDPPEARMRDLAEASGINAANQAALASNADQREIELCR